MHSNTLKYTQPAIDMVRPLDAAGIDTFWNRPLCSTVPHRNGRFSPSKTVKAGPFCRWYLAGDNWHVISNENELFLQIERDHCHFGRCSTPAAEKIAIEWDSVGKLPVIVDYRQCAGQSESNTQILFLRIINHSGAFWNDWFGHCGSSPIFTDNIYWARCSNGSSIWPWPD